MPDTETLPEQQSDNGHSPVAEGTMAGSSWYQDANGRKKLTPQGIREAVGNLTAEVMDVGNGPDFAAGYREAVSPGESPSDIFARTQVNSINDVKFMAASLALQMEVLKDDPLWKDEVWLQTEDPATAYIWLENVFMKSLKRQSLKEATMGQTGIISPDSWDDDDGVNPRRRRRN